MSRKFGDVRARDCKGMIIRLPDDARKEIEAACGRSAALVLTDIALKIATELKSEHKPTTQVQA